VVERAGAFECQAAATGECDFAIPRRLFGGEVRAALVRDLLSKGRTFRRTRFVSRAGKPFNAHLRLAGGRVELDFSD
jgi:DNA topoisomerase-3